MGAEKEGRMRGEREKRKGGRKDSYSRIPSFYLEKGKVS
jgi:hypothetical protein